MNRHFTIVRRVVLCVLVAAASTPALEAQDVNADDRETRIFQIEHVWPTSLFNTLQLFGAPMAPNNDLRTLTVTATPAIMTAIADVISRLDVPPPPPERGRSVELTMHILSASNEGETTAMPPVLDPVIAQLQNVLTYRNFQLLDTVMLRTLDTKGATMQGTIVGAPFSEVPGQAPILYSFTTDRFDIITPDSIPVLVRLTNMGINFKVPVLAPPEPGAARFQIQYADVSIGTDVDIAAGQQVVVGKATVGQNALILVMSADFLD